MIDLKILMKDEKFCLNKLKIDNNKSKFQREQLINEGGDLFKKYLLIIPIFLIVIVTIILKYTNNDE